MARAIFLCGAGYGILVLRFAHHVVCVFVELLREITGTRSGKLRLLWLLAAGMILSAGGRIIIVQELL
jgi:hypothetical protein